MIFPVKFIDASTCTITSRTQTNGTTYGFVKQKDKIGDPHEWRIEFNTRKLFEEDIRELMATVDSFDGRYENFTLPCPLRFMSASDSFTVSGGVVAGQNTLTVDGLPSNVMGALKAGDYIKFASHSKAYKIAVTANSNSSGEATLTIYPRLFANVSDNETVTEAVFTCEMLGDTNALLLDAKALRHSQLLQMVEVQ